MKKFYLTFGFKYSHETHPAGSWIHPDGYIVITAKDYQTARNMVVNLFGVYWADLYAETQFTFTDLHPRGALLNIQVPENVDVD